MTKIKIIGLLDLIIFFVFQNVGDDFRKQAKINAPLAIQTASSGIVESVKISNRLIKAKLITAVAGFFLFTLLSKFILSKKTFLDNSRKISMCNISGDIHRHGNICPMEIINSSKIC